MSKKYVEGQIKVVFQEGMDYENMKDIVELYGGRIAIVKNVFGAICTLDVPRGSEEYWKNHFRHSCPAVLKVIRVPKRKSY